LHDIFLSAADKDRRWGGAGLTNATDLKKAIGRASELDQSFGRPVLRRRRFNLGDEEDRGLRGTLPRPKIETPQTFPQEFVAICAIRVGPRSVLRRHQTCPANGFGE
jgi:hypothetical protein